MKAGTVVMAMAIALLGIEPILWAQGPGPGPGPAPANGPPLPKADEFDSLYDVRIYTEFPQTQGFVRAPTLQHCKHAQNTTITTVQIERPGAAGGVLSPVLDLTLLGVGPHDRGITYFYGQLWAKPGDLHARLHTTTYTDPASGTTTDAYRYGWVAIIRFRPKPIGEPNVQYFPGLFIQAAKTARTDVPGPSKWYLDIPEGGGVKNNTPLYATQRSLGTGQGQIMFDPPGIVQANDDALTAPTTITQEFYTWLWGTATSPSGTPLRLVLGRMRWGYSATLQKDPSLDGGYGFRLAPKYSVDWTLWKGDMQGQKVYKDKDLVGNPIFVNTPDGSGGLINQYLPNAEE